MWSVMIISQDLQDLTPQLEAVRELCIRPSLVSQNSSGAWVAGWCCVQHEFAAVITHEYDRILLVIV